MQHDIAIEVAYRAMTEAEMEGKEKVKGKGKEVAERRKLVISKPLDIFSVRLPPFSSRVRTLMTETVLLLRRLAHPPRLLPLRP